MAGALGGKVHTVDVNEGTTVEAFLDLLLSRHGERLEKLLLQSRNPMELVPHVKIYVNGRGIDFIDGLHTVLHDGSDVLIMPQVGGG